MVGFTARLELPAFIPKEHILGKHVFDSKLVYLGLANDWTYSADGQIAIIVNTKNGERKTSTAWVPFSQIERVGQFILLKTNREKFIKHEEEAKRAKETKETKQAKNVRDERKVLKLKKREDKKKRKKQRLKNGKRKYADELDFESLEAVLLEK